MSTGGKNWTGRVVITRRQDGRRRQEGLVAVGVLGGGRTQNVQGLENKCGGEGERALTLVCQPPPAPTLNGTAARGCAARRTGPATSRLQDVILIHSVGNGRVFFPPRFFLRGLGGC